MTFLLHSSPSTARHIHIRYQTPRNSSKPVFPFVLLQPNLALLARISLARPLSLRAHMTSRAARSAELARLTADHTHPLSQHALLVCRMSAHGFARSHHSTINDNRTRWRRCATSAWHPHTSARRLSMTSSRSV